MKVLAFRDLRAKGIPFCRQHITKLVKKGKFPAPGKIGLKTNAWDESEIDQYLEDRLTKRGEMKTAQTG
jgi:prophage regulatory protein